MRSALQRARIDSSRTRTHADSEDGRDASIERDATRVGAGATVVDDDDDDDELGARGYHRFETHERERDARHGTRDATGAE